MKYTEKFHAERLLGMLNKKNPCLCCPAGPGYQMCSGMVGGLSIRNACSVCKKFVGMTDILTKCPCDELGEEKAIKRTWIALEQKGYI